MRIRFLKMVRGKLRIASSIAFTLGILLLSSLSLSRASDQVEVLEDFEAGFQPDRWQGQTQLSTSHPAHGRHCLEVKFSKSAILSTSLQNGDWRGFERLLFDVYNPETMPLILSLRLYDAVGGDGPNVAPFEFYQADRKLFLGAGWTHVEVVMKNLKASSELRPMALGRMRRLTIAADPRPEPLTLFFDNFRLVTGSEDGPTASSQAPQDTATRLEGRWVTVLQTGPRDRIPESEKVAGLRRDAEKEYRALQASIRSSEQMGLDTIYPQAELVTAELGLYFRPLLPWFNNDREKQGMFSYVAQACRRERERLESLLGGAVRLPERDDTQIPGPLVPPYPRLRGLAVNNGFFESQDGRPLYVVSLHGPSQALQKFFATPMQHIESYSVGGGSRWTVDASPVYEAFNKYPETRRVGWDGWCGHLIRDLHSMGGKKENVVICLESPHIREAVERYIEGEVKQWSKNPELLYNIMAYELQYICYCERSQQMFRSWLERRHGSLSRLNEAWGTQHKTFQEIVAPPTKQARPLPGTNRAQWYDWAVFNQDRFSDYLVWVKSVIRRFDPQTPLAAGGSSSMLTGSNGTSGIDEEQIINRVDDVIIHEGSGSTLGMDLQVALSEKPKPLCDPEMSLGQVRYLLPHMLHGKSVMQLWHWPDQPPSEYPHLINSSFAHGWKFQLSDLSALFRAVLDGRRLSPEISAFSTSAAQAAILYSRTSMVQIPPEMLTWRTTPYLRELENCYEASRFLDTRVTFVSESQILRGKLSQFKLLIIPAASHMRAPVVEGIISFVEQGGALVMLPSSLLSDEYNRPADYLGRMGVQVRRIEQPVADRTGELEQAYDQSFHERVVYRPEQVVSLRIEPASMLAGSMPNLRAQGARQEMAVPAAHDLLAAFPNGQPALVSIRRGRGVIYYSATGFVRTSLGSLLDRLFETAGVSRPVRVRGENGQALQDVEARYVESGTGKLLYIVNFNERNLNARLEVNGRPASGLFELRKQVKLADEHVLLPAGDTLIFRLD